MKNHFLIFLIFTQSFFIGWAQNSVDSKSFTIAVIGDQQVPIRKKEFYPSFIAQTAWLAKNARDINLRFVTQVGDIVEHGHDIKQWKLAEAAMTKLDDALNTDGKKGIPWNVAYGNHEVNKRIKEMDPAGTQADLYRKFFGGADIKNHRYSKQESFKGVSSNGLNTYHIIKAGSREYLMLNLEYDVPGHPANAKAASEDKPAFDAIQWAQTILDKYPEIPTIVTTHIFEGTKFGPPKKPYTKGPGRNSQIQIFDKLIKSNKQIFLILSGHTSEDTHKIQENTAGFPVLQMVTDYNKKLPNGGDGFMRLIEIDEKAGELRIKTFTPGVPQNPEPRYKKDKNSEFIFKMDWQKRF